MKKNVYGILVSLLCLIMELSGKDSFSFIPLPPELQVSTHGRFDILQSDYFCGSLCIVTKKNGEPYVVLGCNAWGDNQDKYSGWGELCTVSAVNLTKKIVAAFYNQFFVRGILLDKFFMNQQPPYNTPYQWLESWVTNKSAYFKEKAFLIKKPTINDPHSYCYLVYLIELPWDQVAGLITDFAALQEIIPGSSWMFKNSIACVKQSDLMDAAGLERPPYKVTALLKSTQGDIIKEISVAKDFLMTTGLLLQSELVLVGKQGKEKVYYLLP